jgi:hypothetical protein
MKLLERYSAAVNSDNLSSDARTTWADADVLGAAGLAAKHEPLGVALTRLFADGKPEATVAILTEMVFKRSRTIKVKFTRVEAEDLAKAVLGWYRHGTCQPCGGTGYRIIPGTPSLGDECPRCRGTGKLPFDEQFVRDDQVMLARWLSSEIDRSQTTAGRTAMALLAPRLDV